MQILLKFNNCSKSAEFTNTSFHHEFLLLSYEMKSLLCNFEHPPSPEWPPAPPMERFSTLDCFYTNRYTMFDMPELKNLMGKKNTCNFFSIQIFMLTSQVISDSDNYLHYQERATQGSLSWIWGDLGWI